MGCGSLLDRDGGGDAFDFFDVWFFELVEELPRVRGERFHVLALTLSEDRVEREGGLSRPRQSCDDDELVARDVDVEGLEVVLFGASDADALVWINQRLHLSGFGALLGDLLLGRFFGCLLGWTHGDGTAGGVVCVCSFIWMRSWARCSLRCFWYIKNPRRINPIASPVQ